MTLEIDIVQEFLEYVILPAIFSFITVPNFIFFLQCLVIIKKKCRCGMHEKELPCSKEFTCETKCKQTKDCEKHPCNRKVYTNFNT